MHEIGTDASPYGLGGWYAVDGKIIKYFSSLVTTDDLKILSIEQGSCDGQQVLESLAILVALRLWVNREAGRIRLSVRGDNVGALTLLIKMRPSSPQQAIIAREIALMTAHMAFPPAVTHPRGGEYRGGPVVQGK